MMHFVIKYRWYTSYSNNNDLNNINTINNTICDTNNIKNNINYNNNDNINNDKEEMYHDKYIVDISRYK